MTSIEQQIQAMEELAARHFPDDLAGRNECLARLLKERLRAYAAMFQPLKVRDEMRGERG